MRALATLLALLASCPCLAWGADGHRIVGTIASSELTPTAAAEVRALLGDQTLADACVWADEIRSDPRYDWVAPLHYINAPLGATSVDMKRDANGGKQVVTAIGTYREMLKNTTQSREERLLALRLLLHFVADIHQPFHVSYAKDKGGNALAVQAFGERSNMHRVWDSDLIRRRLKETTGGWATMSADLRQAITDEQRTAWRKSLDPVDWANESFTITRRLYVRAPDPKTGVDDAYWKAWMPTVDERLQMAGIRLGAVLNESFPEPKVPHAQPKP